jgi:hypothetical protein
VVRREEEEDQDEPIERIMDGTRAKGYIALALLPLPRSSNEFFYAVCGLVRHGRAAGGTQFSVC